MRKKLRDHWLSNRRLLDRTRGSIEPNGHCLLDRTGRTTGFWTEPVDPLTAGHNERDHRLLDQRDHRTNVAETIS